MEQVAASQPAETRWQPSERSRNCSANEHEHCSGIYKTAGDDNLDVTHQCGCACHREAEETPCPKRDDKQHCNCWYDGAACCACGAPPTEKGAEK